MSARMMSKDLLLYIDSFTEAELEDFTVTMTEGAESGMVGLRGESRVFCSSTTHHGYIISFVSVLYF